MAGIGATSSLPHQNTAVTGYDSAFEVNQQGFVKPNSLILPAIWATWASECVLALRA
jgi:hypothetical protein